MNRPKWKSSPITEGDLTIIMLTINKLPPFWAEFHKQTLLEAAGNLPIITISKIPMDWDRPNVTNILQEVPEDMWERVVNVYSQILRGAELAKTPYVAIAEDDCLYPKDHFTTFRPPLDTFAYNHSRWCIFSWEKRRPFYYHMPSDANCLMIAPREKLVNSLRGEHPITRRIMHRLQEPCVAFYTHEPVLCFYHDFGNDYLERSHRKKPWPIWAYNIPKWGKAKQIITLWR